MVCGLALALPPACSGELDSGAPGSPGVDAGSSELPPGDLDVDRAQARFATTTDLVRQLFAPGCAAENNECHNNEDFPDLSSEGNLFNLIDLPCNLGVGDRSTVEGFCEALGDELRVTSGAASGFSSAIGSIHVVTDDAGTFSHYEIALADPLPQAVDGGSFEIARDGQAQTALGGGSSLSGQAGDRVVWVNDATDLPAPDAIKQGDENGDGVFGAGTGLLVHAGSAANSYLVRRLLGYDSDRVRMPLNTNADNPTEANGLLTRDEMYAVMSWVNCLQLEDGPYAPIHYDCAANAGNDGTVR